ncbi:peptidoglycan-binding protein [Craterilacuibacter sp. RT1T]|uniref:peptidoglycan-binding protein n=1 Tax=Craterilacuibacter sp. RT1T TaxID=2942211 RepID=UPI0020BE21FD|nr:peptidoglycan-binding protein [Craterilacuibacter sp. RT1T]MCL6262826.1 peptidoglycan-binding protein [Craterilacuibacter sp. RT1T]
MKTLVDILTPLLPKAKPEYLQALREGDALLNAYELNTPLRLAHFLAQMLHETGGLSVLRENMNYSAPRLSQIFGVGQHSAAITPAQAAALAGHPEAIAERVYGLGNAHKARELGNTEAGDGFRFRGNGLLQTTGRGNHRRMGDACGVDFETHPEWVTAPAHALKPALAEWREGKLNALSDKNDMRAITRAINGGYNGLAERKAWFARLWPLLQSSDQAAWQRADTDDDSRCLQQALNDLGANPKLKVDGRYGPATTRAVRAFQQAAHIKADGIAGPVTRAAIKLRLATLR